MDLISGYLGLVSFHFYYPITLAYVTSRVLRPPWGRGIRCRLRQPLLGQVFEIWLIFRYRHASSSGSRLFDVWVWFSCVRIIGIASLTMIDLVSPDFWLIVPLIPLGHIPFHLEVHGSSWTCVIIIAYWMLTETWIWSLPYHDSLVEPPESHPARPTFLGT